MPMGALHLKAFARGRHINTEWGVVGRAFVSMRTGSRLCTRWTLSPGEYIMAHQHSVHTTPMLLSCVMAARCSASCVTPWP
jgi:hypothetical protein